MTDPTRLIDAYLDGRLSPEELAQLERDIASNPAYADAFAKAMMIDAMLSDRFVRESIASTMQLGDGSFLVEQDLKDLQEDYDHATADLVTIVRIPSDRRRTNTSKPSENLTFAEVVSAISYGFKGLIRKKRVPFIGMIAAAIVLFLLWLVNPFAVTNNNVSPPPVADGAGRERPIVATLLETYEATWSTATGHVAAANGDGLRAGQRLTLTHGLAKIKTSQGAIAILEAPCTVELSERNNELSLIEGKLYGICATEGSRGFTIQTRHARMVDLGTRFGVQVQPNGDSEVHVDEGEVVVKPEAHAGAQPSVRALGAGEALSVTNAGETLRAIPHRPLAFVDEDEFQIKRNREATEYSRWLANSYELRRRSDLIAYYTFEQEVDHSGVLPNRASATSRQNEGWFSDELSDDQKVARWTQGRWPGKGALQFDGSDEHVVRVPFDSAKDIESEISVLVWVKLNDISTSHHLLTQYRLGQYVKAPLNLGWNGDGKPGKPDRSLFFAFDNEVEGYISRFHAVPPISAQQWVCFVVTCSKTETTYFLNGKAFASDVRTPGKGVYSDAELVIGGAYHIKNENLKGVVDELAVFSHALSEQDVASLYEAGKP